MWAFPNCVDDNLLDWKSMTGIILRFSHTCEDTSHGYICSITAGMMRRWLEEDNKGVEIMGIRWLLKEHGLEKAVSSLVI